MNSRGCDFDVRPIADWQLPQVPPLIRSAVQAGARVHYSDTQISAWIRSQTVGDSSPYSCTFAAFARGEMVGIGRADLRSTYPLRFVFVAPDHWRRGIGRALVISVEQFCARGGVHEVYLAAALNAVGFYEVLGYKVHGRMIVCLSPELESGYQVEMQALEMSKSV